MKIEQRNRASAKKIKNPLEKPLHYRTCNFSDEKDSHDKSEYTFIGMPIF